MKGLGKLLAFLVLPLLPFTAFAQDSSADTPTTDTPADTSGGGSGDAGGGTTDVPEGSDHNWTEDLIGQGIGFMENEIDEVIFRTNEFLSDATFIGPNGPFFWILNICSSLAALFCLILAASMAYKMLVKHEAIDVLKLLKPLAIAAVLSWWYPPSMTGLSNGMTGYGGNDCVLDVLAVIPNAIGSYTRDLYDIEAQQLSETYSNVQDLIRERDNKYGEEHKKRAAADDVNIDGVVTEVGAQNSAKYKEDSKLGLLESISTGAIIFLDKMIMFIALIMYRIGWWGVIYVQQILLAVLTIFGPVHWAMSLLPKWETGWSKWIIRYISVHFYGAMLYFVGFYVLLLFDIVFNIQLEDLRMVMASDIDFAAYMKNAFFTTGYLLAASVVALKCIGLVPDLASWMIPEGEAAMSVRSFGENLSNEVKQKASSLAQGGGLIS